MLAAEDSMAAGPLASCTTWYQSPPQCACFFVVQDREAHLLDYPALSYPHIFVLQAGVVGDVLCALALGCTTHTRTAALQLTCGSRCAGRVQGAVARTPRAV